jgi:hypothetical protein
MSLPSFKFTNIGAPTNNERVNSGLSVRSKIEKSGILSTLTEKAQNTMKEVKMPDLTLDTKSIPDFDTYTAAADTGGDGESFFSGTTLIKLILIIVIGWFMWSSLSANGDFHLGMGEVGEKVSSFFKTMEEKGRELVARITNQPISPSSSDGTSDSDSDSDSDDDARMPQKLSDPPHRPPVPPGSTNSSNKTPGFINDDSKYTFLDKADRGYTGPSPRADDSTSVTQKHQAGKAGYCYIGEDRGFRSCAKVEAGDKCMSGQVFSRQDICVDPTLRE